MKFLLLLSTFLFSFCGVSQSSTFYSVSPFNNDLSIIDTSNFTTTTVALTSSLGGVNGCNGLEVDPNNPCDIYVVYKVGGQRRLGLVDPVSGDISDIGALSENIANIAFGPFGLLFAVSGDGSATPESLFELNTVTAGLTFIISLGNGDDGESIAFNPDDGLMYHWSGWGLGDVVMETIDMATFTVGPTIPLSGSPLLNVGASTYIGNNTFMVSDVNGGGIHFVTTTGVVSPSPITTGDFKGLTVVENPVSISVTPNDTICANETAVFSVSGPGTNGGWYLDGVPLNDSSATLNANTSGSYSVVMDQPGCSFESEPIDLVVNGTPNVNLVPSDTATFCQGDSTLLSVSGGTNADFQWFLDGTPISGAITNSYDASIPGTYNCTKTNGFGCTDSSAVGITVIELSAPTVVITPGGSAEFCTGDSVELTVNSASQYQWYLDENPIAGATDSSYFVATDGVYNCVLTDTNGCIDSASVGVAVNESPLPVVMLTPEGTVSFCPTNGPVTITADAGLAVEFYQWYGNGNVLLPETMNTFMASTEGTYNCVITSSAGCSDSALVNVLLIDTCDASLVSLEFVGIQVYPNPTTDFINVDLHGYKGSSLKEILLITADGKLVSISQLKSNEEHIKLDVSNQPAGRYFLVVRSKDGQHLKEIRIE
jgi:hypothetical protein